MGQNIYDKVEITPAICSNISFSTQANFGASLVASGDLRRKLRAILVEFSQRALVSFFQRDIYCPGDIQTTVLPLNAAE